jgi:hypothetical protein
MITYNDDNYYLDIVDVKPGNAVCIIDTDVNVDFAEPKDYKEHLVGALLMLYECFRNALLYHQHHYHYHHHHHQAKQEAAKAIKQEAEAVAMDIGNGAIPDQAPAEEEGYAPLLPPPPSPSRAPSP